MQGMGGGRVRVVGRWLTLLVVALLQGRAAIMESCNHLPQLALGRRSNLGDAPFKHKPHRELQGARDLATRIEGSAAAKLYEFD